MERRILFTDLDGTLLDDKKKISPGNQAAIDEALAAGHKIVASTGRPLASALIHLERLGLTKEGCYAITYNGGQIYDSYHKKTLYGKTIPRRYVRPLFELAAEMGLYIQTYSATHILTERETDETHRYSASTELAWQVVDDVVAAMDEDPYKLLAIDYENHQKLVDYGDAVMCRYPGTFDCFFSNDDFLEVVPSGISKGFAVRWMCDFLGIPIENSVAAGDAQNDIAMLEAAHVGAVMCNAFPGIAEHGNYITKADNNHDGVAEIIRRFILQTEK